MKGICVGALLASCLLAPAVQAGQVQGKAEVPFSSGLFAKGPTAEVRQAGIKAAKLNAWNRYTANFNPARMKSYKAIEADILAHLDEYIIDYSILDEAANNDAHVLSVSLRASINDAAVDARLNAAGSASASAGGGQMFSFVFVARDTATLKSFQDRNTSITSNESELIASKTGVMTGAGAALSESSAAMNKVTTGGSTLRQADDRTYRVRSGADIDAALVETLTGYGF